MESPSRSETAKRADTEFFEGQRQARMESTAQQYNMAVADLNSLILTSEKGGQNEGIKGMVNGVEFEGYNTGNGTYKVRLDGKGLSGRDAEQAYEHVLNAVKGRDSVNRIATKQTHEEIAQAERYEPQVAAVRDKFYGGKTPEHEGFSKAA